jgi:hypothetical protein
MLEIHLTRKLSAFVALSETDLDTLARVYQRRRWYQSGNEMVLDGQKNASAFILAKGWAFPFPLPPSPGMARKKG